MQPGQSTPGVRSPGKDRAKHAMQVTAILHIVSGSLCAALGAAAIGTRAGYSYLAVPIWSGLFFFLVTGNLGLCTYRRGTMNTCMVGAYLGMSIVSLLSSLSVAILLSLAAAWEYFGCYPLTYVYQYPCYTSSAVRITIDSLIVTVACFEVAVSITSLSATGSRISCCRKCCKSCCKSNNEQMEMPSVTPGNANNRPVYFIAQEGRSLNHAGGLQTQAVGPEGAQIILMQTGNQGNVQTGLPQTVQTALMPLPPVEYVPQRAVPSAVYLPPSVVTEKTGSPRDTLQSGISDPK